MQSPKEKIEPPRIHWIDNLKAILFLIGLIYHLRSLFIRKSWDYDYILTHQNNFSSTDTIFWFLHLFRIQIFFIVSGYLFYKYLEPNKSKLDSLKKITTSILVPTIFSIILILPLTSFLRRVVALKIKKDEFIWDIPFGKTVEAFFGGTQSLSYLWYLVYLLLFQTISILGKKYFKNFSFILPIILFVGFLSVASISGVFSIGDPYHMTLKNFNFEVFGYYFLFFVLGIFLARRKRNLITQKILLIFVFLTYLVIHYFAVFFQSHLTEIFYFAAMKFFIFMLSVSLSLSIFQSFETYFNSETKFLNQISKYSMSLYIFHFIYLTIGFLIGSLFTASNLVLVVLSLGLTLLFCFAHIQILKLGFFRNRNN